MKVGDMMCKIGLIEFTDKKDNYELLYKWCSQKFIYEWFEQRKLLHLYMNWIIFQKLGIYQY